MARSARNGAVRSPRTADTGRLAIIAAASHAPRAPHEPAGGVAALLQASTFEIRSVTFDRTMLDDLSDIAPDAVLLEYHHDSFDLVRVCRDLSRTLSARIIVVSSDPDETELQIAALDAGADDFVPATTSPAVLSARIRAALRGMAAAEFRRARLSLGDVVIDIEGHALQIAGVAVGCPPLQFSLLVALARSPNRVVDRGRLLAEVWGAEPDDVDPRRVRIAISVLRRVLGTGPDRPRIETVSQVGYRLVADTVDDDAV